LDVVGDNIEFIKEKVGASCFILRNQGHHLSVFEMKGEPEIPVIC
jgi:hypothetical protein